MIWIVIMWLACGFLGSGFHYAYDQRAFPSIADRDRDNDTLAALCVIPLGVLLFATLDRCRYGWLLPGRKP